MANARRRLKLFTGAPLPWELDWEHGVLLDAFIPAFDAFLRQGSWTTKDNLGNITSSHTNPRWRTISFKANSHLRSGWSQPVLPTGGNSSDLSFSSIPAGTVSFEAGLEDTTIPEASYEPSAIDGQDDPFLEHSLAFHETLLSSQLAPAGPDATASSTSFLTTSFGTNTTGYGSPLEDTDIGDFSTSAIPPSLLILSLSSLPSASHLSSIHPQTPTPNFICVLMSKDPPRNKVLRASGKSMRLHEITVADETRGNNFTITFWLPSSESQKKLSGAQEQLCQTLDRIQKGDVLLLRNVALSAWRGTVFGQSLNPHIARARTTIDVLVRASGSAAVALDQLPVNIREKTERVRKWASNYVVPQTVPAKKRKREASLGRKGWGEDELPPDTME